MLDPVYYTREVIKCPKCKELMTIEKKSEIHRTDVRLIEIEWRCTCGIWRQQRLYDKVGLVINDDIHYEVPT